MLIRDAVIALVSQFSPDENLVDIALIKSDLDGSADYSKTVNTDAAELFILQKVRYVKKATEGGFTNEFELEALESRINELKSVLNIDNTETASTVITDISSRF